MQDMIEFLNDPDWWWSFLSQRRDLLELILYLSYYRSEGGSDLRKTKATKKRDYLPDKGVHLWRHNLGQKSSPSFSSDVKSEDIWLLESGRFISVTSRLCQWSNSAQSIFDGDEGIQYTCAMRDLKDTEVLMAQETIINAILRKLAKRCRGEGSKKFQVFYCYDDYDEVAGYTGGTYPISDPAIVQANDEYEAAGKVLVDLEHRKQHKPYEWHNCRPRIVSSLEIKDAD